MAKKHKRSRMAELVSLWARRSALLDEVQTSDLYNKSLNDRLKSISYFNGLFEKAVKESRADHSSSGLLEYRRLISKLKTRDKQCGDG